MATKTQPAAPVTDVTRAAISELLNAGIEFAAGNLDTDRHPRQPLYVREIARELNIAYGVVAPHLTSGRNIPREDLQLVAVGVAQLVGQLLAERAYDLSHGAALDAWSQDEIDSLVEWSQNEIDSVAAARRSRIGTSDPPRDVLP